MPTVGNDAALHTWLRAVDLPRPTSPQLRRKLERTVGNVQARSSALGASLNVHCPAALGMFRLSAPGALPGPAAEKALPQGLDVTVAPQFDMLTRAQLLETLKHGVLSLIADGVVHVDDGTLDSGIPTNCVGPLVGWANAGCLPA